MKRMKCFCCKENGHTANDCQRDPNIRTNLEAIDEMARIDKFKEYKKLNSDSFLFTQKFFENMARDILPKNAEGVDLDSPMTTEIEKEKAEKEMERKHSPFRGMGLM
jgi:hypothetical protein